MSKKDLSQLYCLNREIAMQKKRLAELESKVVSCSMNISGMPKGGGVFDKVGEYGAEIGGNNTVDAVRKAHDKFLADLQVVF